MWLVKVEESSMAGYQVPELTLPKHLEDAEECRWKLRTANQLMDRL